MSNEIGQKKFQSIFGNKSIYTVYFRCVSIGHFRCVLETQPGDRIVSFDNFFFSFPPVFCLINFTNFVFYAVREMGNMEVFSIPVASTCTRLLNAFFSFNLCVSECLSVLCMYTFSMGLYVIYMFVCVDFPNFPSCKRKISEKKT